MQIKKIISFLFSSKTLDVNTFKLLDKYNKDKTGVKLTPDHIPSYGALAEYFESHQFNLPKRSNSNLEGNSSSIMIPTALHQIGSRTYGGRNNKEDSNGISTRGSDARNLLKATILDIVTTAYLFNKYNQYKVNYIDYINSAMVIVERNKLLCMYDVPYKFATGVKP